MMVWEIVRRGGFVFDGFVHVEIKDYKVVRFAR